jgi:hypothetical protein
VDGTLIRKKKKKRTIKINETKQRGKERDDMAKKLITKEKKNYEMEKKYLKQAEVQGTERSNRNR